MSLQVEFLSCQMKPRCPVYTIAIEQRHRRHAVVRAHGHKSFGQGSAFEKAESRSGMEFYIHVLMGHSLTQTRGHGENQKLITKHRRSTKEIKPEFFVIFVP